MKIFISWSGDISHKVANELKEWIPLVLQSVDPFISSEDVQKGARWFAEISTQLEKVNFSIICLTPQNINAPWLLFESGAVSKKLGESFVVPLLIGLRPTDLSGPLAQFQATTIGKDDIYKTVKSINEQLKDEKIKDNRLEKTFGQWWPQLEKVLKESECTALEIATGEVERPKRDDREILEEILLLSRSIATKVQEERILGAQAQILGSGAHGQVWRTIPLADISSLSIPISGGYTVTSLADYEHIRQKPQEETETKKMEKEKEK